VGKLIGNPLYTIVYARRYKTLTCPVHLHTLLLKKCKIARLYSSHKYYRGGLYERQNTRNGDPAHTFFNETFTSTVIDIDRESAILFLNEYYDSPCPLKIGKYLAVVGEFRLEVDG
jgi:hypothetical protein